MNARLEPEPVLPSNLTSRVRSAILEPDRWRQPAVVSLSMLLTPMPNPNNRSYNRDGSRIPCDNPRAGPRPVCLTGGDPRLGPAINRRSLLRLRRVAGDPAARPGPAGRFGADAHGRKLEGSLERCRLTHRHRLLADGTPVARRLGQLLKRLLCAGSFDRCSEGKAPGGLHWQPVRAARYDRSGRTCQGGKNTGSGWRWLKRDTVRR